MDFLPWTLSPCCGPIRQKVKVIETYKIIIADDEPAIRDGLSKFVEWKSMGFELVSVFRDGDEVVEFCKSTVPDVALVDINMNKVSGLDVAKYIHERQIRTKIVILTGYKDFDFAKRAIEYGVENYLLKPTDMDELEKVFRNLKKKLDSENKDKFRLREYEERSSRAAPIITEQILSNLYNGLTRTAADVRDKFVLAGIEIDPAQVPCFVIEIGVAAVKSDADAEAGFIGGAAESTFESGGTLFRFYPIAHTHSCILLVGLLSRTGVSADETDISRELDYIKSILENLYAITFDVKSIQKLESIMDLLKERERREKELGDYESVPYSNKSKFLFSMINSGETAMARESFLSYLKTIMPYDLHTQKILIYDLLANVAALQQLNAPGENDFPNDQYDCRAVLRLDNLDDIRNWGLRYLVKLENVFRNTQNGSVEKAVQKAIRYMQDNYCRDLSLTSVAESIYLNPSYLSRIFKQYTGKNFTDFLTRVRINKAVEFLRDGRYKIYEIGERVGYHNSKYFIKQFKQITGFTPKNYRVNLIGGENREES